MSITKKLFGDWCQSQKEFGQSLKKISEYWKTARDTKYNITIDQGGTTDMERKAQVPLTKPLPVLGQGFVIYIIIWVSKEKSETPLVLTLGSG